MPFFPNSPSNLCAMDSTIIRCIDGIFREMIYRIFDNHTSKHKSEKMNNRVRPFYTILLLIITAASLTTLHLFNLKPGAHSPPFNQTLLKQAEIDVGEPSLKQEIEDLLGDNNYRSTVAQRSVRTTFSYLKPHELRLLWSKFKESLSEWSEKRALGVISELELGLGRRHYNSCAVVGNSGILLGSQHGQLIDSHEAVVRLNNARTEGFEPDVGSRTSVSFVNSNVLHACARRGVGCSACHVYGERVPIVTYACQLAHIADCLVCNESVILTDPRFDVACARIVRYYSLRRFGAAAREGEFFHYSSGMQAVMMAAGVCRRVSLFGFGKSGGSRHHYHTRQVAELSLHDYEAEYDFYRDLAAGRGGAVPFVAEGFEFPPVVMYK